MALIYCYGENELADAHAKETAEILCAAYPNHSWWVECKGGVIVIKHFGISGIIGMLRKLAALANDAEARKREIIRAAGELLERAGLPRRDYRGEQVTKFEADGKIVKHFHPLPAPKIIH
jgi:hypothetical protein